MGENSVSTSGPFLSPSDYHSIVVLRDSRRSLNWVPIESFFFRVDRHLYCLLINPFMPTVAFNICFQRDCVSRHNGGTSGAPLKPLRDDRVLRALSSLRGLREAPEGPPLCRETSVSRTANVCTVGMNGY